MTTIDAEDAGAFEMQMTLEMYEALGIAKADWVLHGESLGDRDVAIFFAGYRMGAEAMRERAATVCTKHDTGDMQREDMEARRIADAIRSLPVEE